MLVMKPLGTHNDNEQIASVVNMSFCWRELLSMIIIAALSLTGTIHLFLAQTLSVQVCVGLS